MLYDGDSLVGLVGAYVDDCLMCGDTHSKVWNQFIAKFKKAFTWSPWEYSSFMFTGSRISQQKDWTIVVSQEDYAKALKVVDVPRSSDPKSPLTAAQIKELRGLDGSLQWLVTNSRLDLAAPTSISQSHHESGKIQDLQDVNKLARTAFQTAKTTLTFFSHIKFDDLCIVTFHDAGQGSRPDGSSQGGYLTVIGNKGLLKSQEELVTILDWRSFKLRRVARSSLAAEVQAFSEGIDSLDFARLHFAELKSPKGINLKNADSHSRDSCEAAMVTDCKSLWDAVVKSTSAGLGMAEKRTSIEVLAGRERMESLAIPLKWANSDRQLADGLTKTQAAWKLQVFQLNPRVRLVYDPELIAAKKIPKSGDKITTIKPTDDNADSIPLPPNTKPVKYRKSRITVPSTTKSPNKTTKTTTDSRKTLDKQIAALAQLARELRDSR